MPSDLRDTMRLAAGQPSRGPDVEAAMRRGTRLRRRRQSSIALATVAVVAVAGVVTESLVRPPAPEIGPIGEVESPLGAVIVHDAWLEVDEATFHSEDHDGSPDEARSEHFVWNDRQQAWVGPRQSLYLHLEIPEGADGFLIEDDDGLIRPTRQNSNPGPWVVSVPLEVYHDRVHETADELEATIRAVASAGEEYAGPSPLPLPDWPDITETSAPTRVFDVRPER